MSDHRSTFLAISLLLAWALPASVPGLAQTHASRDASSGRKMSQITQVQVQTEENHTRVLIEVEDKVEYRGARIANPDRIYFDLRKTKLSPSLAGRILEVQSGGLLKAVRAAQNQVDVVRVVLEVNQAKDYSVAWLPDPYRLVVNVNGSPLGASATLPTSAPTPTPNPRPTPSAAASAPNPPLAKSALAPSGPSPGLVAGVSTVAPQIRSLSRSASRAMGPAMGPLVVSSVNPRYFTDGSEKAVYLVGSHAGWELQDDAWGEVVTFDFNAHLDFLTANNLNFIRMWMVEHTRFDIGSDEAIAHPMVYTRTGPGNANDGRPKFDLSQFDEAYFDRLRSRVAAARDQGIYVAVMLFQGWSIQDNGGGDPWPFHPFHADNNINAVNGDPGGNGDGKILHTLQDPEITALQQAYVRKMIDTLNDLDNVLWEISNESPAESRDWQYYFIDFIHNYETTKPAQHPVIMTALEESNANLFASPAEAISPVDDGDFRGDIDGPPMADGSKVIIADTDHLFDPGSVTAEWVWKSFLRGLNPVLLDPDIVSLPDIPPDPARQAMSDTRAWADRIDLINMTPQVDLASSGYALANPGVEYLIYSLGGEPIIVDVSDASGTLALLWFDPRTGDEFDGGTIPGGNRISLTAPFDGPAVLFISHQEETRVGTDSRFRLR